MINQSDPLVPPRLSEGAFFGAKEIEVLPGVFIRPSLRERLDFTLGPNSRELGNTGDFYPFGTTEAEHVYSVAFQTLKLHLDRDDELLPAIDLPSSPVGRAALIAATVHASQTDKLGFPYIEHPRRVFRLVLRNLDAEKWLPFEVAGALEAAWLHDVIEDSAKSFYRAIDESDLSRWGISPLAVHLVRLLTRDDVPETEYYSRISTNPLARLIKLCDIADNLTPWRVALLESQHAVRLAEKYQNALNQLDAHDEFLDLRLLDETTTAESEMRYFATDSAYTVYRNIEKYGQPIRTLLKSQEMSDERFKEFETMFWHAGPELAAHQDATEPQPVADDYESLLVATLSAKLAARGRGFAGLKRDVMLSSKLDQLVSRTSGIAQPDNPFNTGITSGELALHAARAIRNLQALQPPNFKDRWDHTKYWELVSDSNLKPYSIEELMEVMLAAFAINHEHKYLYLKALGSEILIRGRRRYFDD